MRLAIVVLLGSAAWAQASSSAINPGATVGQANTAAPQTAPVDPNTLLPELAPVPHGKATLIGGTIGRLDRVRNEIVIRPFGGGSMKVLFDGRTQIVRDGNKVSPLDLRNGEKIYLDTVLDGTTVFAKMIRVTGAGSAAGESTGQIVAFDQRRSEITLNDNLSPETIRVRILPGTRVMKGDHETSTDLLKPGTLVAIQFRPGANGAIAAQQIAVLAEPGTAFAFVGRVTFLDLHKGMLVVMDPRDKNSYEVHFNPATVRINGDLQLDSDVTLTANFDGKTYATSAILVTPTPNQ
jgi:hypothetical protein